ncbi:MAG TPA: glutathione peroxidase [Propionibacteriaceae bacterium]|nr:glutathione peroxidase [Propionibacteriaceae bacterium]
MTTLQDFTATTIKGAEQPLGDYLGKVVLVVNTASKCGYTPQFEELQTLYQDMATSGFVVLGFPCDQFKHQEFDSDEETAEFCRANYGVTFPMFHKVDVNGPEAHPLFAWLRSEQEGPGDIQWNFTKFLLDRDGQVVQRYEPEVTPLEIEHDIRSLLY